MSRSSGRGQVEPLSALVAVVVVFAALGLYAVELDAGVPEDRDLAPTALDAVHDHLRVDGVVRPERFQTALAAGPDGHRVGVTLAAAGERWTAGASLPPDADRARRRVAVRVAPGRVRTGWLVVVVA